MQKVHINLSEYFWQFRRWSFCVTWIIQSVWFEDVQLTQVIGSKVPLNLMLVNDTL